MPGGTPVYHDAIDSDPGRRKSERESPDSVCLQAGGNIIVSSSQAPIQTWDSFSFCFCFCFSAVAIVSEEKTTGAK